MAAPDPLLDTASQRPPTGMDEGARHLILKALAWTNSTGVMGAFFDDRCYADENDYLVAVERVWGPERVHVLRIKATAAADSIGTPSSPREHDVAEAAVCEAVLLHMPEPDFRSAVFIAARGAAKTAQVAPRINHIRRMRGMPWVFSPDKGFCWVGDEEVESRAIRPAMSAIEDSRFADGVKDEFVQARAELARGTPGALAHAVHKAGCAVESAMKVLLGQHGQRYGEGETAHPLFDRLVEAGLAPPLMQACVLGAASLCDQRTGHGDGDAPREVSQEVAEAVLASAAVAIAYLHKLLPS